MGKFILPKANDENLAKLAIILTSAVNVMDVMRYNEFEEISPETAKIFSLITDNSAVVNFKDGINDTRSFASEYKVELHMFLKLRVTSFVDSIIRAILNNNIGLDGYTANSNMSTLMPLQELRLIEYDILRKTDQAEHFNPHEYEDHNLAEVEVADLRNILVTLLSYFEMMRNTLHRNLKGKRINAMMIHTAESDYTSTKMFILVGHLIAHTARAILSSMNYTTEHELSGTNFHKDAGIVHSDLIYPEFTKYSNIGSMTIANIICCYQYEEYLPNAVYNTKGSLGHTERRLLAEMLVISKLTKDIT